MLTSEELRLAATAAERWPVDVKCAVHKATRDIRYGEMLIDWQRECGCPALVASSARGCLDVSLKVMTELWAVFEDFITAIDAGRGAEVAEAFRRRADELEAMAEQDRIEDDYR